MTMFMFATVQRVGNASLLVYDHSGSQEVVVHTPNAHCFSPGEEILIKYNLPYKLDINIDEIKEAMTLDKKNLGKKLNLIFINEIGNSFVKPIDQSQLSIIH